jgi:hypothetical protein
MSRPQVDREGLRQPAGRLVQPNDCNPAFLMDGTMRDENLIEVRGLNGYYNKQQSF